jgi:hypothetical protein
MRSLVARTWFGEALVTKLQFGPMSKMDALMRLGELANAGRGYEGQLGTLIEYMEETGLVRLDGDQLRLIRGETEPVEEPRTTPEPEPRPEPQRKPTSVQTSFAQPTDGLVAFNVTVHVDMNEFATWQPARITAFFGGIAQVLAAKAAVEHDAST